MQMNQNSESMIKTALLSAVFTLVLFSLANYFLNRSWNFFSMNGAKQQPFTVQGSGTATATPDQAQISFTVTKSAPKLGDAQNEANSAANSIVNDLQKAGIEKKDIKTGNYNSRPNYSENTVQGSSGFAMPVPAPIRGNSTAILSYTVDENVEITIRDVSKINDVIDVATKGGAENIFGPNFTFSESEQQKLEDQARTEAIESAKQKAAKIAAEAGIRLGKISSVQENSTPFPIQPMMLNAKDGSGGAETAPTQINPGENTVTENITLTFETR